MRDSLTCENHTCQKAIAPDAEYSTCMLCREPAYCSDECSQMDRILHACDNEYDVKSSLTERGFAVPYYGEDALTQDEVNELEPSNPVFSAYSVRHAAPNRVVTQAIVPPLVEFNAESKNDTAPKSRGTKPPDSLTNYALSVTVISYEPNAKSAQYMFAGQVPKDMVYPKNRNNEKASKLANLFLRGLTATTNHLIFWPHDDVVANPINCPLQCDVNFELFLFKDGQEEYSASPDARLNTGFSAQQTKDGVFSSLGRRVREKMQRQLSIKFQGDNISTDDLHMRRYGDGAGNGVILTFKQLPKQNVVQIVDIEFLMPAMNVPLATVENCLQITPTTLSTDVYKCDPKSYQDVSALVMSIGQTLAIQGDLMDEQEVHALNKCKGVITAYAHEMEANQGQSPHAFVPSSVQAAIGSALDITYEHIGAQLNIDYYYKKMFKPYSEVAALVREITKKMKNARDNSKEKNIFKKAAGKLTKSVTLRSLQNLNTALSAFIGRLKQDDLRDAAETTIVMYEELRNKITQAM